MPGIFGFTHKLDQDTATQLSNRMANALQDEPQYLIHQYTAEAFSLGQTSLGIINPAPQPAWNETHTVAVVMDGEIYNDAEKRAWLQGKGHQFQSNSHAELFVHYYEEAGANFVASLNGDFSAAIWDQNQQKLLLVNDHLGLHPLYYMPSPQEIFAFASGVRALMVHRDLSRSVDRLALAQFLTFDHVLDDRTLLNDVKCLPAASVLTFANGNLTIHSYWRPQYPDHYPVRSEAEYQEELLPLLRQAVLRRMPGQLMAAILMSGGLDSRVLAALFSEQRKDETIQTFTFGVPHCDDERYAKEVSTKLGLPHRFYPLQPDYLLSKATQGIRLTDGMENVVHMHTLPNLNAQAQQAQVMYKGFLGDALIGYGISERHWANYNDTDIAQAQFAVHQEQGLILFPLEMLDRLLLPQKEMLYSEEVLSTYAQAMRASQTTQPADQRNYFDLLQRVPRMTINGVELVRSQAHVRLPFTDKDLVDFMLTVPPGYRSGRKIMKDIFIQQFPELAKIPYTETNYPLVHCMREALSILNGQTRWWLWHHGLRWVATPHKRSYALYNQWLRNELRQWVEDTLLSKRTLERGYFDPATIKTLVVEQMAGQDHYTKLGALISIELWHRQFIDSENQAI